jgi:hypothetical protein
MVGQAIAAVVLGTASWSCLTGRLSFTAVALVAMLGQEPIQWWFQRR